MSTIAAQLVVIAKAPVPGRVKTRLTPPFTSAQAARLAAAALGDTLAAAARVPFIRRVLALADGPGALWPPGWRIPPGFELAGQCGGGLDERIEAALASAHARLAVPAVLIGMDTPQVSPALLQTAACALAAGHADATFGPARDGGFWLLGLRRPAPGLVRGVPMSDPATGGIQLSRLRAARLRVQLLPELTDVDTAADAALVGAQAPASRFAGLLHELGGLPEAAGMAARGR